MSLNLNHVTLAGNLTRDPDLRQIGPDRVVAHFGLAINRRWRNQAGESVEEVTFVDIEAWGRTGELAGQYLKKGSPAYIEGRLKLDAWEDSEGKKRQRLKVIANTVQFLGTRPAEQPSEGADEGGPAEAQARPATAPARARPAPTGQPIRRGTPATAGGEPPPF
jgi:single-strand DNA-binding protein